MIWEALFWLSAFGVFYAFVGYPLAIGVLAYVKPSLIAKENIAPSVSLIICVYNEEAVIQEKIENSLALDYPKDKIEIIVASDCSTDRTNQIVSEYLNRGINLLTLSDRKGKTA